MKTKSFFKSMEDNSEIWINQWIPDSDDDIKAVVLFHHGLKEHSLRYDRLGSILSEKGFALVSYDMRGHGRTAENAVSKKNGLFGMVSTKNGVNVLIQDLEEIVNDLIEEFPGKKIILAGHAFGALISQLFIEINSSKINGCILLGTYIPSKFIIICQKLSVFLSLLFHGKTSIDSKLDKKFFGIYNKKIKNHKTENDWISKNELNVCMYEADNWCGIPLRVVFYQNILSLYSIIFKSSSIKKIDKNFPVYLLYGSQDLLSQNGKSVKLLYHKFLSNKMTKLQIKEYDNARNEILNEDIKVEVENDIISWINTVI